MKEDGHFSPENKITESTNFLIIQIIKTLHDKSLSTDVFPRKLKFRTSKKKEKRTFSNWHDENTAANDYLVNNVCLETLFHNVAFENFGQALVINGEVKLLHKTEILKNQARLQVLSLCAKNRAEFLSDRADFYPIYMGLTGVFVTLVAFVLPEYLKVAAYIGGGLIVAYAVAARIPTRLQVAELKMMANMLDAFDKKLPGMLEQAKREYPDKHEARDPAASIPSKNDTLMTS